ncbi:deoxyguanosinetriphosphate triphosphohydrolase [Elysia marginata]|uniref:Deoxyguanosinetriphosphate triphosphohydrolase n=1 Tax=Elysia marginata TaxID=1093978 RepID=A0AAV4ERG2_9GAST|nr:deoxyguanosinetriphosphate triphosphohydrolase [Elysia marginata]
MEVRGMEVRQVEVRGVGVKEVEIRDKEVREVEVRDKKAREVEMRDKEVKEVELTMMSLSMSLATIIVTVMSSLCGGAETTGVVFHSVDFSTLIEHRLLRREVALDLINDGSHSKQITFRVSCPQDVHPRLQVDRKDGELRFSVPLYVHENASFVKTGPVEENSAVGHRYKDSMHIVVQITGDAFLSVFIIYEQLMLRKDSLFKDEFSFDISNPIRLFLMDFSIQDAQPFNFIRTTPITKEKSEVAGQPVSDLGNQTDLIPLEPLTSAYFVYTGNVSYPSGMSAGFSVNYDMEHLPGGEILVNYWTFLHTTAPEMLNVSLGTPSSSVVFNYGQHNVMKFTLSTTVFSDVLAGTELIVCGQLRNVHQPFPYSIETYRDNTTANSSLVFQTDKPKMYFDLNMWPVGSRICHMVKTKQTTQPH